VGPCGFQHIGQGDCRVEIVSGDFFFFLYKFVKKKKKKSTHLNYLPVVCLILFLDWLLALCRHKKVTYINLELYTL